MRILSGPNCNADSYSPHTILSSLLRVLRAATLIIGDPSFPQSLSPWWTLDLHAGPAQPRSAICVISLGYCLLSAPKYLGPVHCGIPDLRIIFNEMKLEKSIFTSVYVRLPSHDRRRVMSLKINFMEGLEKGRNEKRWDEEKRTTFEGGKKACYTYHRQK